MTPEDWHERNHVFPGPMTECHDCARLVRRCRGKVTYPSAAVAAEAARSVNVERDWEPAVVPYGCRYCNGYHLATARDKHRAKRAERDRRKWLRGRELGTA